MIFEVSGVFSANQEGTLRLPDFSRRVELLTDTPESLANFYGQPMVMDGLKRSLGDFALLSTAIGQSGAYTIPFFVTDFCNENQAVVAAGDLIVHDPWRHMTECLARTLQSIEPKNLRKLDEIYQELTVLKVAERAYRAFPK